MPILNDNNDDPIRHGLSWALTFAGIALIVAAVSVLCAWYGIEARREEAELAKLGFVQVPERAGNFGPVYLVWRKLEPRKGSE